ncbi:PREDICTED: villin-3-like isoform X1 [Ipomoea nil]|uniref:villin-3-like isoform X1 n=1 Tax=Ipomoea nil TaxID=35883 RepID=UPI00090122AC|nr:PREDICTED: villin-3-like isoform X1 [Ipomoea nil]XP_019169407.1 PREDICTED: villin-3-like isoform X1 [Ipomoea nil]XP_019169415.1 PREDICTED: villin-3-like isoform X1 [Ipomoea nil]
MENGILLRCYLLDCGEKVFFWVGRVTQVNERKSAIQAAEEFIDSQNRPKSMCITRLIQGYETHSFKSIHSPFAHCRKLAGRHHSPRSPQGFLLNMHILNSLLD